MDQERMNNRLEYKYVLPVAVLEHLRRELAPYLVTDAHAACLPGSEYTVRSVYWDTPALACYREKLDGKHSRRKFRVRGYDRPSDRSQVFFEIKRKENDFISKSRARIPWTTVPAVLSADHPGDLFDTDQRAAFTTFRSHWCARRLAPSVLIVYDREAFECPRGSRLRVTFDKNVRSKAVTELYSLFDDEGLFVHDPASFILEVKFFQTLPRWISTALGRFDLIRVSASKYASAIEHCRRPTQMCGGIPAPSPYIRKNAAWQASRV